MDKLRVLNEAKEDIRELITKLDFTNIGSTAEQVVKYFTVLSNVAELPTIENVIATKPISEEVEEEVIIVDDTIKDKAYPFERKLKGGFVDEINGWVPEKIVRELELRHGDLVYAYEIPLPENQDSPPHYSFEVAERRHQPEPPNRVQLNLCRVKDDRLLDRFVVEETVNGALLKYNDSPMMFSLDPEDVRAFNLEDGDIIDIAYYKGKEDKPKVLWKHITFNKPSTAPTVAERQRNYEKKVAPKEKKEYGKELEGNTVLMIGFEPGKTTFGAEIENRGGTFIWSSGKEGRDRLESMVTKADCVIMMQNYMSHNASITANDIAKEHKIPCVAVTGFGRTSFVQEVYYQLGIKGEL